MQILRIEEVKYGENEDEIYGILFDGAWLWEEYINTILHKMGFIHPENKLRKGYIYLFEDIDEHGKIHRSGLRYPDFYKDDMVLDAKYKLLGSYEKVSKVDRDDIHQVITYMTNLNSTKGGFIAPLTQKQTMVPTSHLKGTISTLSIFGIEINKTAKTYKDFCDKMNENEVAFIQSISQQWIV